MFAGGFIRHALCLKMYKTIDFSWAMPTFYLYIKRQEASMKVLNLAEIVTHPSIRTFQQTELFKLKIKYEKSWKPDLDMVLQRSALEHHKRDV
jgi:allophanate hydrolase subunit 1